VIGIVLRVVVAIYGVLMLLGAELLMLRGVHWVAIAYLAVNGVLIAGGVIFERSYYLPRLNRARGQWELTGERFVDPTTKRLVEVRYNPATGERDYVDASPLEQG
jgi:hypothetical protein